MLPKRTIWALLHTRNCPFPRRCSDVGGDHDGPWGAHARAMSIKNEYQHPAARTSPQHMTDSGQCDSAQEEMHRLPSQDAERTTTGEKPRGRVLLVEDDPLIRKFISRQLVAAGYIVRVAFDGLDAIGKLRAGPLEVIISDLNMPRMAGFEFLDVVRKRFPQIPVIVISGVAAHDLPEGVAADAYCPKNEFISEQLLQTMSDLTRRPNPRTAPPPVDNGPVQPRQDDNGCFIIRCEECFREFSVPRVYRMGRDEARTTCVHCAGFVRFLITEHSEGK
jgi:CheY-like chemotaxis protein